MMADIAHGTVAAIGAQQRRRALVAAAVGNTVEWFDFAIYGYMAVTIGQVFFPSTDPVASLLSSFAVFAVAFAVRPLGGLVFGPIADRVGRRHTLAIVIVTMSAATFVVGLLPSYATIGILAPVLLVLARVVQGLSAGGEVGSSATYLAEISAPGRRGLGTSWIEFSTLIGLVLGSLAVLVLRSAVSDEAFAGGWWRLPFLLGGVLGAVGLYIRLKIDESPYFDAAQEKGEHERIWPSLRRNWRQVAKVLGVTAMQWVAFYIVLTYMQTYLTVKLAVPITTATFATLLTLVVTAVLVPLAGALSDRIGRRPLLIFSTAALLVGSWPLVALMNGGGIAAPVIGQVVLGALFAPFLGTVFATLTELFPTRIRTTGFSIGYNVAGALLGGTAPYVATALGAGTGSPYVPAFMVMAAAVVTLCTLLFAVEETVGVDLDES